MTDRIEQLRELALQVAIALMLISGVSPLGFFTSEIEHVPYGLAVVVLLGRRPPLSFLITVTAATVFWVGSLFYWGDWSNWVFLIQFINVLTPIVFFATLRPRLESAARVIFWLYLGVGTVQLLGLLVWAEPFLGNFIPRFSGTQHSGYRGVQGLESEPARAAFQLIMLYIIGRPKFRNPTLAFAVLLLAQVVMIRATIGLMLTAVLVGFQALSAIRRFPKYAPLAIAGLVAIAASVFFINPKIEIIVQETFDEGPSGLVESLRATSGGRFIALEDAVVDIVTQPLGRGADPGYGGDVLELAEDDKFFADDGTSYPIERASRPVSATLNAIRTFGVPIALLAGWAIWREMFDKQRPNLTTWFWFVVVCSIAYGPSGSESLLIALGVAGGAASERTVSSAADPEPVPSTT